MPVGLPASHSAKLANLIKSRSYSPFLIDGRYRQSLTAQAAILAAFRFSSLRRRSALRSCNMPSQVACETLRGFTLPAGFFA
jgi:hypothetical protein